MLIQEGERWLFIGDSITDCGRLDDPEGLGRGYVRYIRDYVALRHPSLNVEWINRGVSGNRVVDLYERWETDVIRQQPDWVSISIGINDVWRQLDQRGTPVYIDEYQRVYAELVEWTKNETEASLILMETTVIEEDLNSEGNQLLKPYNTFIRELAAEHGALLVPMNQAFRRYLQTKNRIPLTTDGVHLTSTGNMLMAWTGLEAVQAI